jgi:transcriptional regulator with GAF, ATPase, and Fis domain
MDLLLEQDASLITVPFIVIADSSQLDYSTYYDSAIRQIIVLSTPLNRLSLEATIDAHLTRCILENSLADLRKTLLESVSLHDLAKKALEYLLTSKYSTFTGATITMVANFKSPLSRQDGDHLANRRYFLASLSADSNFDYSPPLKEHLKPIGDDRLIQNVIDHRIFILQDIEAMMSSVDGMEKLRDVGWDINSPGTRHVKSWVGFTASSGNQPLAIITLDNQESNAFRSNDPQLLEFLKKFAKIFASSISIYAERNNAICYKKILDAIANPFTYQQSVKALVHSIKDALGCDECDFFSNEYDGVTCSERLTRVASTRMIPEDELRFNWGPNRGIAGKVMFEKHSHLVPNCSEDRAFVRTPESDGGNLSMMAIPILLRTQTSAPDHEDTNSNPTDSGSFVQGVIICEKRQPHYFNIYQERLLNDVSFAVSSILLRALILEISRSVISNMVDLIPSPSHGDIQLDNICKNAVKLGLFKQACIYLFESSITGDITPTVSSYYSYPLETFYNDIPASSSSPIPPSISRFLGSNESEGLPNPDRMNEDDNQITIALRNRDRTLFGLFSLTKVYPIQLSLIQCQSLDLLARLITTIVSAKKIISQAKFLEDAHGTYSSAIQSIGEIVDIEKIVYEIAKSACGIVSQYIQRCEDRSLTWTNSTVDSLSCVIMLPNAKGELEIRAMYPPSIFPFSLGDADHHTKAADIIRQILVANACESQLDTREYFEFNFVSSDDFPETSHPEMDVRGRQYNSVLRNSTDLSQEQQDTLWNGRLLESTNQVIAVPIALSDKTFAGDTSIHHDIHYSRQVGIMKLESPLTGSLEKIHSRVLLHLADQIKYLFKKKHQDEKLQRYIRLMDTLYNSLNIITSESLDNMLSRAVLATQSGLGPNYEVYVLRASSPRFGLVGQKFSENNSWPPLSPSLFKSLKDLSEVVYDNDSPSILEHEIPLNAERYSRTYELITSGLCVPFRSKERKLGVFWILLKGGSVVDQDWHDDICLYTVFANQLATAFSEKEKYEQAKARSIDKLIEEQSKYRKMAASSANINSGLAYLGSFFGLIVVVISLYFGFSPQRNAKVPNQIALTILGTFMGASVTAITQLIFARSDKANERIDNYYRSLSRNADLNFLMHATEGLDPAVAADLKKAAIDDARSWIKDS